MSSVIVVGGRSLAIGGAWSLPGDKAEAVATIRDNRGNWIVNYQTGPDHAIGAFKPQKGISRSSYSGALACAMAARDAVVLQQLDDDTVWAAAVRDGIPLPNYDHVCDADSARQILTDILSFNPTATVVGNWSEASVSLEQLLSSLSPKQWKEARLSLPHRARTMRVAASIVAIVMLGAGAVAAWLYIEKERSRKAAAEMSRLQALKQLMETQENERKRQAWERAVAAATEKQRQEFTMGVSPSQAIEGVRRVMAEFPVAWRGWQVGRLECQVEGRHCMPTWLSWRGKALAEDATRLPGGPKALADLARPDIVSEPMPWAVERRDLGRLRQSDAVGLLDINRLYGVTFTVGTAAKQVYAQLPPKPEGLPEAKPAAIGKVLTWETSGPYASIIPLVTTLSHKGIAVTRVTLNNMQTGAPMVNMAGQVFLE